MGWLGGWVGGWVSGLGTWERRVLQAVVEELHGVPHIGGVTDLFGWVGGWSELLVLLGWVGEWVG